MNLRFTRTLILGLVLATASLRAEESLAARVIILANRSDPESVALARHYAEKRAVPGDNIIALPMSQEETITWRQFVDTVYQPLQDELVRRGWIDAIGSSVVDKIGRKKYAISGHRISYLVVCRGVPLRISHDPELYAEAQPFTRQAEFRTNCAAVDGELGLLAQSGYAINAFIPNPLFHNDHPAFLDQALVVKVSRLDGPTYADAAALVDNALKAEQQGLIGRAYADIGGPSPTGDKWFENVVRQLDGLGFDLEVDRKPTVFPFTARFDAPVLYFGWYAGAICGPFAQPGFRFPPGAIAFHIYSFSAQTMHAPTSSWCGPLVARGVTATLGNVYEPYLEFSHHPHLLVHALAAGNNFGDAACYALPALSWQDVAIGDPLYRPFVVPFAEQWKRRKELPDELFPYVVFRELKRLELAGQSGQVAKTATEALRERPGLVLALRVAQVLKAGGDRDAALRALDSVAVPVVLPMTLVPVAAEAARFYSDNGAPVKAVAVYRQLLEMEILPREQRLALLPAAAEAAKQAGNLELASLWARALEDFQPAEVKK